MAMKYNNKWITIDGIRFQSREEGYYYELLKRKKAQGEIVNYELQPRYTLQGASPSLGLRKIEYVADFLIYHLDGTEEAVDIKGMATETALLKRKLFLYNHRNVKLTWLCRNLKRGDKDGWIEYEELKRRMREEKK